jgi:hypothetical protein
MRERSYRFCPLDVTFPADYQPDRYLAGTTRRFNYESAGDRRAAARRWQAGSCRTRKCRSFTTSSPLEVL